MEVRWNQEKAKFLKQERNISIEAVAHLIINGPIIKNIKHPNQKKYPNQFIAFVWYNKYICKVPYIFEKNGVFIKTIYPDGKATRKYLKGEL